MNHDSISSLIFMSPFMFSCSKDYVDIFKVVPSPRLEDKKEVVQVGHYCGERFPGPQDEDSQILKVILHSDDEGARKGFRAKYEFLKRQPLHKSKIFSCTNFNVASGICLLHHGLILKP